MAGNPKNIDIKVSKRSITGKKAEIENPYLNAHLQVNMC